MSHHAVQSVREHILSTDNANVLSSSVGHPLFFYPLMIATSRTSRNLVYQSHLTHLHFPVC